MSTDQAKAIARTHYDNVRDLEAAFKLVAPQVKVEALPGLPPTYDGWVQGHSLFLAAFPDQQLTVEDQVAEGDAVVTRWTFTGTHQGPLMGIPATGRRVVLKGLSMDRIEAGQVVEHWAQIDQLSLMQQLGVIPAPQAT
jgi:predicted ester cyclase